MKRKRNDETKTGRRKENPFLKLQTHAFPCGIRDDEQEDVLSKVLAFSEATQSNIQKNQEDSIELTESAMSLIEYLESTDVNDALDRYPSTTGGSLFSPSNVATMLLEWAVKKLVYLSNRSKSAVPDRDLSMSLYWKTLRCTLSVLLSDKDHACADLSTTTVLSQSTLHQLVPFCARNAFADSTTDDQQTDAALCFTLLADHFYRPTIDSACHSLLPLMDDQVRHINTSALQEEDFRLVLPTRQHVQVLISMIQLIKRQQNTSNPKRVFQILAEPKVLVVLARWRLMVDRYSSEQGANTTDTPTELQATVQDLLFKGLFDPLHHIEGFRGLNLTIPVILAKADDCQETTTRDESESTKTFHCYQETLLKTAAILTVEPNEENSVMADTALSMDNEGVAAAVLLLPHLMNGLVDMFARWERDSASKLRRKGGRDMAPVQFRLWCNLVAPLVMRIRRMTLISSAHKAFVVLRSIREALSLVLQHNLYLSSHKDEHRINFLFLEALTVSILDVLEKSGELRELARVSIIQCECLQGLETLLSLNHHLLHDRLHVLMAMCNRVVPRFDPEGADDIVQVRLRSVFVAVIRSYHRLRQLDHVFTTFLQATHIIRDDEFALISLKEILLDSEVKKELSVAVSKCPSSQIKDLFHILNAWIQERINAVSSMGDIAVAASLFIILIQNVRVDKHTSVEICELCEETVTNSIYRLISGQHSCSSHDQDLRREALMLTGWIIDLRNQCTFWIDETANSNSFDIVASVLRKTRIEKVVSDNGAIAESLASEGIASMLHEIEFLLLHRIRELHSAIYEEKRAELVDHAENQTRSLLELEARRLVDVVITIAQNDNTDVAKWKLLSETVLYWAPYSKQRHADAFLSWLFAALSVRGNGAGEADIDVRNIAEALLNDASFFEISELTTRLSPVGLVCALDLLKSAVAKGGYDSAAVESSILVDVMDLTNDSKDYSSEQLGEGMSAIASRRFRLGDPIDQRPLQEATQIVRLLNGVPQSSGCSRSHRLSIQLDILCCVLCLKSGMRQVEASILQLMCASRTYLASSIGRRSQIIFDRGFPMIIEGFLQSTTKVMKHVSSLNETAQVKFLRASETVTAAITDSCISSVEQNPEPMENLLSCFRDLLDQDQAVDVVKRRVLMHLSRSIVKRLVAWFQLNRTANEANSLHGTISPFITDVAKAFGVMDDSTNDCVQGECLLLNGDLVRLRSLFPQSSPIETLDSSTMKELLESTSPSVARAAEYYLFCIVSTGWMPGGVSEVVVDKCLRGSTQLLEATFCALVRTMEANALCSLLERLRREARTLTSKKRKALYLFQLILDNAQDEAALSEVSRSARAFFDLCLGLLFPFHETDLQSWVSNCKLGTSLLVTLTENKGIISIRERDLGVILAQVSSVLGDGGSFRKADVGPPVDGRVYSSCLTLVSSLLQRFPKQLYACAPSVISTMHTMLKHALYGSLPEQDVTRRAQMFTRLCELLLPHRDVYKKHILVLILEYVGALRGSIHPSRSKGIQPAVYYLIDMLSQYETEQLNTMMDTTATALFRSVYQGYQKTHMYKGQY